MRIISAVASGRFQYPSITCGPRMQSSPRSPTGSSRSGSPMSTILQSVSGAGRPIEPTRRSPFNGFTCVIGEHSVSPYPSTKPPPVSRSNFSATDSGNGAAPEMHALIEPRSYLRASSASLSAK